MLALIVTFLYLESSELLEPPPPPPPEEEELPLPPLCHTMLPSLLVLSSVDVSGVVGSVVSLGTCVVFPPFNTLSSVETASALVMPLLPPKLPSG